MAARRTQTYLPAKQRKRRDGRRRRDKRMATALDSTFGAIPRLDLPSRDDWSRRWAPGL